MTTRILSPEHVSAHDPEVYANQFEWAPRYSVALASTSFVEGAEEPEVTVLMLDRADAERIHSELAKLLEAG
jgi:hypothetical protein